MDFDYGQCPKCKNSDFLKHHKCPPEWELTTADNRDEPDYYETFFARRVEDAIDAFCHKHFGDWDYPTSIEVLARPYVHIPYEDADLEDDAAGETKKGEWQRFDVQVEREPVFVVCQHRGE